MKQTNAVVALTVSAGLAILGVCLACAADPRPSDPQDVRDQVREPFERIGKIITGLAAGNMEAAYQSYSEYLADPPPKAAVEFGDDHQHRFRKLFERFPRTVDSLDLVAVRRLSSQSHKLTCVANTRQGPVVVEAVAYRYDRQWRFCQVGFQPVETMDAERLKSFVDLMPAQPLASPLSISINGKPAGAPVGQR